ncbi:MAG: penicillin-binding transpeptidase domain-containing protein [Christensenellales bacterium]
MKTLKGSIRLISLVICGLLLLLIAYGAYSISTYGTRWFSSGANSMVRRIKADVTAGSISDRAGRPLAETNAEGKRVYPQDADTRRAMVHAVGDDLNNIAYGAESFMANYLYAFNQSYLDRLYNAIRGQKREGNDITLSLDSVLSRQAYALFPKGKSGALVIMNYRTGELLALQSYPTYDPMQLSALDKENPEKPFWNRATKWVSAPGSTFKVVTLASALQHLPGAMAERFTCTGSLPVMDTAITDALNAVHHELDLERALAVSCNITYAQLALHLGDKALAKTAKAFGFDDYFLFSDLVVENSVYPATNRTEKELAWTGPGQSSLQTTPLHMCMIAAGIANDGVMMEPRLLLEAVDKAGLTKYSFSPKVYRQALTAGDANTVAAAMKEAVRVGTATRSAVSGITVCGKTGSAQIDGQVETNAWYIGFIDDARYPFAVCIVVEDAGGGGAVAAPIAGELFRFMTGRQ